MGRSTESAEKSSTDIWVAPQLDGHGRFDPRGESAREKEAHSALVVRLLQYTI
jgi:hypothetical protein